MSQRLIMEYLRNLRGLDDARVTVAQLSENTGIKKESIKMLIWRLCRDGFLEMVESKTGCQGWRIFKFKQGELKW